MVGIAMLVAMLLGLFAGIPVVFAIGLASAVAILMIGPSAPWIIVPNSMFNGMNSFPLMAVPFFILAGELMNRGGITVRLVQFADMIVGRLRGGLAQANIASSMLFAGITGSALADTAAIGRVMIPAMVKQGYTPAYSAAVTASSSLIGPIIPPSITMILYAVSAGASIGGLFLAGFVPGILIGLGLMITAYIFAVRQGFRARKERLPWPEVFKRTRDAVVAMLMPLIILGGIFGGIVTPTESAAVAVVYALIAGFFLGELKLRDLPHIFLRSGMVTASVMLIVGAARIFSDLLTQEQVPQQLAAIVVGMTDEPWLILLLINVFLLIVGFVMDTSAAIIILVPVLLPIAESIGLHPISFGIIMCVNLIIGLATPPLGVCLFVAADVARIRVEKLIAAIWPFLLVQVVVLLLITYVRDLSTALPKFFGFM